MPRPTRPFIDRIALVFDFDLTLSPGTIDAVLSRFGIGYDEWRERDLAPMMSSGWDEIQAKALLLQRLSAANGGAITRDFLAETGRGIQPFDGVDAALDELRELGQRESGGAAVLPYILSSGFVDIIKPTPVAGRFEDIWGSALDFDESGQVRGVKRAIISIEKARYLTALAKGVGMAGANEPADVDQNVPEHDWFVPLDQMLYVGDGASDIPAFDLVERHGGLAIGVMHGDDGADWEVAERIHPRARVENLAQADYRADSPMRSMLKLAVGILARRVALRRLAATG